MGGFAWSDPGHAAGACRPRRFSAPDVGRLLLLLHHLQLLGAGGLAPGGGPSLKQLLRSLGEEAGGVAVGVLVARDRRLSHSRGYT